MNSIVITLIVLLNGLFADAPHITGKWKTIDDESGKAVAIIEMFESKGRIYGKVVELLNPSDRSKTCVNCSGEDKNKPILGLMVIKGLVREGDEYYGRILDPKHGRIYKCVVALESRDRLKVRGYIGISLIGRTQYWERVK